MNPLLRATCSLPFDAVRPEHILPAVAELLGEARKNLQQIVETPSTRQGVLFGLDKATTRLELALGVAGHLESVAGTPDLRAAWSAVQSDVATFYSEILTSEPLYQALVRYAKTDDARSLEGPMRRSLDKTLAEFRRNGAELHAAGKARLAEIDVGLSELALKFSQNVVDATGAFELYLTDKDAKRLAGLPPNAVEAARASATSKGAEAKGTYRLTLDAPSYGPVLMFADDRALREQMYRAYVTRAGSEASAWSNRKILRDMLALRREKAVLLGFANFADLVTSDRMAKTGANASKFVEGLRDRLRPAFEKENRELEAFVEKTAGKGALPLMPWDVGYWSEKMRKALHDFDEETLRPYFGLDTVLTGLFEIARRLYGVRIEKDSKAKSWHPDATSFIIKDEAGITIGSFFFDPFPRSDKRDGAWMNGILDKDAENPEVDHHVAVIVANMTPPRGPGVPALLSHREVETVFHEFGHMLHHCLSKTTLRGQSGTRVASDFVELPSMIHENWCWEAESLALFARHHETGEPIPEALVKRMRDARAFRAVNALMRQLGFSTVDLDLHVRFDPSSSEDVLARARRIFQDFSPVPLPDDYAMLASFTHLFGSPYGYAAGYYSYQWSERLDADAFTRFASGGVLSREIGRAFVDDVLSRGDSEDPEVLFKTFLGREPDDRALLARLGVI